MTHFGSLSGLAVVAVALSSTSLLPVPASAQGLSFRAPEGCDMFLTVQMKGCLVSHHWRCDTDPEGNHWAALVGPSGAAVFSEFDSEFQWLSSYSLFNDSSETMVDNPADPLSMTELLENGLDSFDFEMEDAEGRTRVRGFDRLTGDEIEIDGERLLITDFQMIQTRDGELVSESTGQQFVSPDLRQFFLGFETDTRDGESFESDNSPVQFIRPGEAGFASAQPIFGCGAQDISYRTGVLE
ncbi:MAG: hypothetical protein AAGF74_12335 [Pseudomonadota bacterium]